VNVKLVPEVGPRVATPVEDAEVEFDGCPGCPQHAKVQFGVQVKARTQVIVEARFVKNGGKLTEMAASWKAVAELVEKLDHSVGRTGGDQPRGKGFDHHD
jgi:hypothetical protein